MSNTPPASTSAGQGAPLDINIDDSNTIQVEQNRTSRASSRSILSSNNRKSRSGSRVSIVSDVQSQTEINDAVKRIENSESGSMILALIKQMNQWNKKNKIDLAAIARFAREDNPLPTAPPLRLESDSEDSEASYVPARNRRREDMSDEREPIFTEDEDIRHKLLKIELNDRSFQRRMIDPPEYFKPGKSSVTGREEEVKMHFSAAFGGTRKFSGKKVRGDDSCILQLLEEFNDAQSNTPVTEREFLSFLAKATTGPAHKSMMRYIRKHRNGSMTVGDIYLALTDIYFYGFMKNLNEYNHTYNSLSEAHNDLEHLAHMVGLSARTREAREVLAGEWYQYTLMNIIPAEFKAVATSAVERCGNLKGRDLTPFEILRSLTKIRNPLDDHFRKIQVKASNQARVRAANIEESESDRKGEKQLVYAARTAPRGEWENHREYERGSFPHKEERNQRRDRKPPSANHNTGSHKPECKLCGSARHFASRCPLFPEGMNNVANSECKSCNDGLFHFQKFCPFTSLKETKN